VRRAALKSFRFCAAVGASQCAEITGDCAAKRIRRSSSIKKYRRSRHDRGKYGADYLTGEDVCLAMGCRTPMLKDKTEGFTILSGFLYEIRTLFLY
jgi:hypothetical protein